MVVISPNVAAQIEECVDYERLCVAISQRPMLRSTFVRGSPVIFGEL
jgi:hypothetical protein